MNSKYQGMSAAEAEIYSEIDQALMEGRPADAELLRQKLSQIKGKPRKNVFVINGNTFKHVPSTHNFTVNEVKKPFDLEAILKMIYPKQYKSLKLKYDTPLMFTDMSPACRRRAAKMIEYHNYPDLTLPYTDEVLALIECAQAAQTNEKSAFFSNFFAAQHATNYDSAKALALCVYFGNTTLKAAKTDRVALYKLYSDEKGIYLEIEYPHTMEDRISHALSVMAVMANYNLSMGFPIKPQTLISKGFQLVSSYNGWNISYTQEFFMQVQKILNDYAYRVARNDFAIDTDLRFPYQLIEPERRFIAWKRIYAMDNYLLSINGKRLLETYEQRFQNYQRNIPINIVHLNNFLRPWQIENCIKHKLIRMIDATHFELLWPAQNPPKRKFEKTEWHRVDRKKMFEANKIMLP